MSKVKEWEEKVSNIYTDIVVLTDKKEFYENEIQYLEQELQEAEMMLGEAKFEERKENSNG